MILPETKTPASSPAKEASVERPRPKELCNNFAHGSCTRKLCGYSHVLPSTPGEMVTQLAKLKEKLSPNPPKTDPRERKMEIETKIRQRSKNICNFARAGRFCKYGDACKFTHPSAGENLPTAPRNPRQNRQARPRTRQPTPLPYVADYSDYRVDNEPVRYYVDPAPSYARAAPDQWYQEPPRRPVCLP